MTGLREAEWLGGLGQLSAMPVSQCTSRNVPSLTVYPWYRRVAERHRDEAGKRCTALQVEAARLKRDCDHKTHEISEIEAKVLE